MFNKDKIKELTLKGIKQNNMIYARDVCFEDESSFIIYFQDSILNNNDIGSIITGEDKIYNQIKINIYNNSGICINDKTVNGNFIKIESTYKYEDTNITLSYYIYESDKKYLVYQQLDGKPKILNKEYNELNEDVFDFIFKEIYKIYKELDLIIETK